MINHDKITEGLNHEQLSAVTLGRESALILAGAGSGKTRVLTSRIAWLMNQKVATDKSILAVTFTNKAAKEMKDRLSTMTDHAVKKMWIGTFHGTCYRMLSEFSQALGLPNNIQIMDEQDQKAHVRRVVRDLGIDKETEKGILGSAIAFINEEKEAGRRANKAEAPDPMLIEIYAAYEESCSKNGLFDFTELMLKTNECLARNDGGMRDALRDRFTDILVDEFQDTNPAQFEWLSYLRRPETVVMAVGDDDQSIYSFRGANPEGMNDFLDSIDGQKVIRLEQNYRSTGNILGAANAVIENNTGRIGKRLVPNAEDGDLILVKQFEFDAPSRDFKGETETQWIANSIKKKIAAGAKPSDIAILYRSNAQASSIECYLARASVPYTVYGNVRFFERQEIKDALSYLRLAINPDDMLSFQRIANVPARGMGDKTISKIVDGARVESMSLIDYCRMDAANGNKAAERFSTIMDQLTQAVGMLSLADAIEFITEKSGLYAHYEDAAKSMTTKQEQDDEMERVARLEELVNIAYLHTVDNTKTELPAISCIQDFLAEATLDSGVDASGNKLKDTVTMMTVHAGKGLEFNEVYISGVSEGLFPHKRAIEEGNVEEERRLAYVGITRAKKNLHLLSSKIYHMFGQRVETEPSRFLAEIPSHLIRNQELPKHYAKSLYPEDTPILSTTPKLKF